MSTPAQFVKVEAITRACGTCRFAHPELMHGQIQKQLVCKRLPPSASTTYFPPRAGAPAGGMGQFTAHPVVKPSDWCYEFYMKESEVVAPPKDDTPLEVGDN